MFQKQLNRITRLSKKIAYNPKLKFSMPNKPKPTYGEFNKLNRLWLRNSRDAVGPIIQTELKMQLDAAMSSSIWNWPNTTQRVNGQVVYTPRDIVDTGVLRSSLSQKLQANASRTLIKGQYNAKYAMITHYGGLIQNYGRADTTYLQPRPWIKALFEGTHGIEKFAVKYFIKASIEQEFAKIFS